MITIAFGDTRENVALMHLGWLRMVDDFDFHAHAVLEEHPGMRFSFVYDG
jgi:hypothetical protein